MELVPLVGPLIMRFAGTAVRAGEAAVRIAEAAARVGLSGAAGAGDVAAVPGAAATTSRSWAG